MLSLAVSLAAAVLAGLFDARAHALAAPLAASTFVVNSTLDEPAADPANPGCISTPSGKCTLRAAIMRANFVGGANTVTVPSGVYLLTRPGYDDDALVGDLDIADDLTIQGAGSGLTIVDGNGDVTRDRVFQVLSTAKLVSLSGLTVRNGQSLSDTVGSVIGGGGLYIEGAGRIQLSDVIFEGNTGQNGGGIYANFSAQGGALDMDQVILRANTAIAGGVGFGGGVFAYLPASSSEISIRNSQVYSNSADGTGGGFYVDGNTTAHWSVERSELYSNTAASGGAIGNFIPLALSDSRLHDNHVAFDGGAIEAFSPLVITRTTLDANTAGRFGGGIFDLQTSAGSTGYNDFAHIVESTLSGNFAPYGGGIYHDGYITPGSLLTLINSTVSGNVVNRNGGGIYVYGGQIQLLNATVASNRVLLHLGTPSIGGGLYITASATFTALNSLIANNVRGSGGPIIDRPDDCFSSGTVGELSFNLITTMTNCFVTGGQVGTIVGQDPLLGPLQNNGSTTWTRALTPGSPAIDAGAISLCPAADQRGVPRPYGAGCDIGAYEFASQIGQSVGFGPVADRLLGTPPFAVTATASSGLTVTFSTNTPGVCVVSASSLNFLGVSAATVSLLNNGNCTLVAQQPGDVTFNPAAPVTRTFAVSVKAFLPLLAR